VAPRLPALKKKEQPKLRPKPKEKRPVVAKAYNPDTTVVFQPPRPTNTRQVLIEPDAPPTPPKFLPALPNIITWAADAPVRPEIAVNPNALVARRPQATAPAASLQAPKLANATPPAGPLNIAPDTNDKVNPPLPITPSAVRAERARGKKLAAEQAPQVGNGEPGAKALGLAAGGSEGPAPPLPPSANAVHGERAAPAPKGAAAPTVTATGNRLVALSLAPGTSLPPPPGNASAPISIGPHVGKDVSAEAPQISGDDEGGAGVPGSPGAHVAAAGPEGLLILHNGGEPAAPPPPAPPPPAPKPKPLPRIAAPAPIAPRRAIVPRRAAGESGEGSGVVPHDLVHTVLGWQVHTLLINMPNLTSATGSWVLNFAALPGQNVRLSDVVAPLPMRKVDPEYPQDLMKDGVVGEVVLYAEIGLDGRVTHIRVVKSVDPRLDANAAKAFTKWKFLPALLNGKPVGLEVLVHIPFRAAPPQPR
jgi:TonB family protein